MLRRADFVLHDFRGSGNRKNCQFAANLLPNAAKKARILLPLLCISLQHRENRRKGRRSFIYADVLRFQGLSWKELELLSTAFSLR
jgi:hypothetical protein